MDVVEREFPAEPEENVPPRTAAPPPRAAPPPPPPPPEVDPRAALRDNRAVNRMETESAHTGTMVELLHLPRATIETIKDLDATVRQQAENNKLQAELNGAVVQMALSTVKQLAESAVRPVVPGKSATEVFGEGVGQVVRSVEEVLKVAITHGKGPDVGKLMGKVLGAAAPGAAGAGAGAEGTPAQGAPPAENAEPAPADEADAIPELGVLYQFLPPELRHLTIDEMREALQQAADEKKRRSN